MASPVSIVRHAEGEVLDVLGVGVRFVCRAEDTRQAWSLMETQVPKGSGPPAHEHPWDEAYYVIAGEIEFVIGGKAQLVRAGDFVYAPGGTVHAFHGASEAPARMLIFDAPAHAERFFIDMAREVRSLPQDLAKVPAIGARHQLRFLPAEA